MVSTLAAAFVLTAAAWWAASRWKPASGISSVKNHEPRIHSRRHLLWMAAEHASDLMNKRPLYTTPDEEPGILLQCMIASRAMELPVVDAEGRLVGDVTMVDLLHFLNLEDA